MERDWLEERLAAGRSIQSIADEAGKGASTVAYWITKHGLVAANAMRHRAKGPVEEAVLRGLVERGLSVREIAVELDRSVTAVRHWLHRHGLETRRAWRAPRGPDKPPTALLQCFLHGPTEFRLQPSGRYRCPRCTVESVTDRRRRVKALLVREAGGCCALCGYRRYAGALQFHHVDPAQKAFAVSLNGATRGIDALRREAAKCVLLCGNCHAEVEAGVSTLAGSTTEYGGR